MGSAASVEKIRGKGFTIEKTEERGITIPQLKAIYEEIVQRCTTEKWTRAVYGGDGRPTGDVIQLTPQMVNLYDINERIIKQYTKEKQCSFVELIAVQAQKPRWFVSHWWGNPVINMIKCLEQHAADRQLDIEITAYWVCAYANNQHALGGEISDDPNESSFRKAMALSDGTISTVDTNCTTYSRIWCNFEMYDSIKASASRGYKLDLYTCVGEGGEAVGICDGYANVDIVEPQGIDEASVYKTKRESNFPLDRILKAAEFKCQLAQAAREEDARHIRNVITGQSLTAEPLAEHPNYDHLNNVLRARFVVSCLTAILEASLPASEIVKHFHILKISGMSAVSADFEDASVQGLSSLDLFNAFLVALPIETLQELTISFMPAGGAVYFAESMKLMSSVTSLELLENKLGDHDIEMLAASLQYMAQLEELYLDFKKIGDKGVLALSTSLHHTPLLCKLYMSSNAITAEGMQHLSSAIQHLPQLADLDLRFNRIGDKGVKYLSAQLQHVPKLERLALNGNRISNKGAKYLSSALPAVLKLEVLSLKQNKITDRGKKLIKDKIKTIPSFSEDLEVFFGDDDGDSSGSGSDSD